MDVFQGSGSVRGTDHVLTAIKDDISIGERAYERTIDALPTLSLLPSSSTHQIFISFREADVCDSFLSHMLMVLRNKGITPFADNNIEKDMLSFCHQLKEAIKGSMISIVIISNNYTCSSWCLKDLVEIM